MIAGDRAPPRWLVTGASGQLGRSLCAVAPSVGVEPIPFARADLDVTNADAIARAIDHVQPDVVLNCAAFTDVDACEQDPERSMRINGDAPGMVAKACQGGALLVHMSTDYVFPGDGTTPIDEDAPTGPISAYGKGKLRGEEAIRQSGCEHLIVRTQWLFGQGRNFVRTIGSAAARGLPLRVVDDQRGRPTWTDPLANGLIRAVAAGARGLLHLAAAGEATWYVFACAIVEEGVRRGMYAPVEVQPVPTSEFPRPAHRPPYGVLGLARSESLGVILPHWRESLVDYLDREHGATSRRDAAASEDMDG